VIRVITRMLKSGIMEDGLVSASEQGNAPRIDSVSAAIQHLPALRVGPVVLQTGSEAMSW
jgi:hypothetical protein